MIVWSGGIGIYFFTADFFSLSTFSSSFQNGRVLIRFEDTGIGIASPENLFRPFQRGAKSTGLGLYVSRAIMRSFGGELKYEPSPEGSRFDVALPLHAAIEEAVNA